MPEVFEPNQLLRQISRDDLPFLKEMVYFATNQDLHETDAGIVLSRLNARWIEDYIEDWGKPGDFGLIAKGTGNNDVGAAWYRRNYRSEIPHNVMSIAVKPEARGRGIGKLLMTNLLISAKNEGLEEMQVKVGRSNENAKKLLKSVSFSVFDYSGGHFFMATCTRN